jgi:hypothetical protein
VVAPFADKVNALILASEVGVFIVQVYLSTLGAGNTLILGIFVPGRLTIKFIHWMPLSAQFWRGLLAGYGHAHAHTAHGLHRRHHLLVHHWRLVLLLRLVLVHHWRLVLRLLLLLLKYNNCFCPCIGILVPHILILWRLKILLLLGLVTLIKISLWPASLRFHFSLLFTLCATHSLLIKLINYKSILGIEK